MIVTENQLVMSLIQELFLTQKVWLEVPNMGQSVDVVIDENGKLIFIEVKLKNWSRAIEQCEAHEIVADYIYVAVATKKISTSLITDAKARGYGVIHYDKDQGSWQYVLKSTKNSKVWKPQRQILVSKLKDMRHVC